MPVTWINPISSEKTIKTLLKTLPKKGNLAWEYNPLRNYRLSTTMYEYEDGLYSLAELLSLFNITPTYNTSGSITGWSQGSTTLSTEPTCRVAGELVDFITSELSFSPEHPVSILPLYSYDGSVNLIINDGLNIPRLINTRFSTTGKDTYEIVDRKGDNDTNIYDLGTLFDIDTSLYKRVVSIPKLKLNSVSLGGSLPVGNYHFYFTLSDADSNESDFIAESGLVSVFIGSSPSTITTGNRNENSQKQVLFTLTNLDNSYPYVQVYYARTYGEDDLNALTQYIKIDKKYVISSKGKAVVLVTGYENTTEVTDEDINVLYNIVDLAKTLATALNMLFLGNVHKPEIHSTELSQLALTFKPFLEDETYKAGVSKDYVAKGGIKNSYYDPKFIYNNVGYWNEDLYRFGIVFIQSNGELTDVYNIRGALNVGTYSTTSDLYTNYVPGTTTNFTFDEETYLVNDSLMYGENVKGVVSFNSDSDTNTIHALEIRTTNATITSLKALGITGFFFVRLKRMPLTLCLAISIATDNTAHTPTIPTKSGVIDRYLMKNKRNTYLEFDYSQTTAQLPSSTTAPTDSDINGDFITEAGINYASEGFLTRYKYEVESKAVNWSTVGKVAALGALVAVTVVATILTCGAVGVALGASVAATTTILGASVPTALIASSLAIGAVAGASAASIAGMYEYSKSTAQEPKEQLTWEAPGYTTWNGRDVPVSLEGNQILVDTSDSRILGGSFADRIIIKGQQYNTVNALLCPEYDIYQEFYNLLFTGENFIITTTKSQNTLNDSGTRYFLNDLTNYRHFYLDSYADETAEYLCTVKLQGVPDSTKVVMLGDDTFRSRAGWAEEAWRYESIGRDYKNSTKTINHEGDKDKEDKNEVYNTLGGINSDIIRGDFGPYVAMSGFSGGPATTVNIKIPDFLDTAILDYVLMRIADNSAYMAISDRYAINDLNDYDVASGNSLASSLKGQYYHWVLHRGDCYICQFTHRVNRNFKDPSTLYNDEIIDPNCWKNHYKPLTESEYSKINLADVNAVQLGMWCTFTVRSRFNLNIRTLDSRDTQTAAITGHVQGYYPYYAMSVEGTFKTPESLIINQGFANNLSQRWNFEEPDVPALKNWYGTRIMYSEIQVTDAFKNNFRVFKGTHYKDYTRQYGEIVKLLNYRDNLLVIFEHGIGLIAVNEKAVAAQSATNVAYITTNNVLNDIAIISESYGSQWADSIIITPSDGETQPIVFGVDTVAKKLWRYDGSFSIISDLIVGEFLNNNITLSEREKTPFIGIRNVKTFYNAFKKDVMFTFYDNLEGFEEKVWNLCYNIPCKKFVTFYSWVPSLMENIDNIPFSFDRTTAKWIAKLGTSHAENSFARGITLSSNVFTPYTNGTIGTLSLADNVVVPTTVSSMTFTLCRDIWGNYNMFEIDNNNTLKFLGSSAILQVSGTSNAFISGAETFYNVGVFEKYYRNKAKHSYADYDSNKTYYQDSSHSSETILDYYDRVKNLPIFKNLQGQRPTIDTFTTSGLQPVILLNIKCTLKNSSGVSIGEYCSTVALTSDWNKQFLTTDFWKHGQAGLIDICDDIYPTYWYGTQHPFEFEFIAIDSPETHKIFTNLELIANKAEPESFHYEIVGESYDFAKDKINMYYRQEARKALFLYNGCNIEYNNNFLKLNPKLCKKSAELVHYYYERLDTINEIYDSYTKIREAADKNYEHLSGAEIKYYPSRNEYRILQHTPAVNIDNLSSETASSLTKGNCRYLEDKWRVSINPLLVVYKNEYTRKNPTGTLFMDYNSNWKVGVDTGTTKIPPITLYNTNLPNAIILAGSLTFPGNGEGTDNALYGVYSALNVDTTNWLNDVTTHMATFGEAQNREEVDIKDRYIKIRIRYSGEDLAVIDYINTIYNISYA